MEIKIIAPPIPAEIIVSADQLTVIGNGTTGDPLRLGVGSVGFDAEFNVSLGAAQVGVLVFVAAFAPPPPVDKTCTVARATADDVDVAEARVVGIVTEVNSSTEVFVISTGVVTLTEGEWSAVTADDSALHAGASYYLSADVPGEMTTTKPAGAGQKVLQVGVALTTTSLLLFSPAIPIPPA